MPPGESCTVESCTVESCTVRFALSDLRFRPVRLGMTETGAFGAWLRACRQSAGLSQDALAGRAGLSVRAVRNLERGRTGAPHSGSLHRLADALELCGEARGQFVAAAGRQLAGDASADAAAVPEGKLARVGARQVVPRQLPGPVPLFIGRERELAALTGLQIGRAHV